MYTVWNDIFIWLCFILLISASRITLRKRYLIEIPQRRKRDPAGAPLTEAVRLRDSLRPSAAVFSFQLQQKLVTCSLSNGDPITALKSLPVTMLICSYLHMRPQKSEANYPLPYPLFLTRLPEIVHSAGGLVRHFQTVKVVQQSFLELQLKCPHWEHINWQRRRRDTPSCFLTS